MMLRPIHIFLLVFSLSSLAFSEKPERIIFLDVDGVLNNSKSPVDVLLFIDPECLAHLKKIVNKTKAKIVLSSTWRYDPLYKKFLAKKFKLQGLKLWVGETPIFRTEREEEIRAYINQEFTENKKYNFVILDDMKLEGFDDNFIHVDKKIGLSEEDASAAIRILKKR